MKKAIIGLAGEFLSGKTSAAKFYEEKFGAENLRFSQILDTILEILDLPNSRDNEQKLAEMIRDLYGKDALAKALLYSTRNHRANIFVFDGIRKREELEALKEDPRFKLIYVRSDFDIRYERMLKRGEKEGEQKYTKEGFAKLIEHDADKDIRSLENYANFVVDNDGTEEEFKSKLTTCLIQSL